ncbi:hypothetical protein [Embleya scabrispora]|uniref:hypothetical protein n=1 Tax=Embleya scabrispora TaxID=159449 RepID=UPI00037AE5FE|nr:hypothetical protein [Embleya scabrispora]MYS82304.1 hypothetical protein [Streptomyces sp. SID5474]
MTWWRNPGQRLGVICAVVAVLVIVGLVHRERKDDTRAPSADGARVAATAAAPTGPAPSGPAPATRRAKPSPVPKNVLPDVVGVDLQEAWDGARRAGYRFVTSHDAGGRGRRQFVYSNWKVCDQNPEPGPLAKELPVDLGVVRHDEKCPAGTVPTDAPEVVDGRMPNLVGRSVTVVRRALRGDAHVKTEDLGGSRLVLIETHWVVCTQRPPEGQPVADTVHVGVVKYGERCS